MPDSSNRTAAGEIGDRAGFTSRDYAQSVPAFKSQPQINPILKLLFDRNETATALTLLSAYIKSAPDPHEAAPVYAYMLNHHSVDVRLMAGHELAALRQHLPNTDLAPLLYSAWKKERNEAARNFLGVRVDEYPYERLRLLEEFYDELRFTVGAKKADLRDRSDRHELTPEQFERALIIIHLDQSGEAKQAASSALFRCVNHLTPTQRDTLRLSLVYGLSDPQIFSEYVISDLLFTAEQMGESVVTATLPVVRPLYDSDNPCTQADAALVGLCLGDSDAELKNIVLRAITDRAALLLPVEELNPGPPEFPFLEDEFDTLAIWAEMMAGQSGGSLNVQDFLGELRGEYLEACREVLAAFNARVNLLCKRVRDTQLRSDGLSRELFVLRASARTDRLPESVMKDVVEALLDVVEDQHEDIKMRTAVASRLLYAHGCSDLIKSRLQRVAKDRFQPQELRSFLDKVTSS